MQRVFEMSIKNTEPVFMQKPPTKEKEHLNRVVHLVPGGWQIMCFGTQQPWMLATPNASRHCILTGIKFLLQEQIQCSFCVFFFR